MKTKKAVMWILIMILMVSLLAGCGGDGGENNDPIETGRGRSSSETSSDSKTGKTSMPGPDVMDPYYTEEYQSEAIEAYAEYLEDYMEHPAKEPDDEFGKEDLPEFVRFSLIYINDDLIPELAVANGTEPWNPVHLFTYNLTKKTVDHAGAYSMYGEMYYADRSGFFLPSYYMSPMSGTMYEITGGVAPYVVNEWGYDLTTEDYYLDGEIVSEEEYTKTMETWTGPGFQPVFGERPSYLEEVSDIRETLIRMSEGTLYAGADTEAVLEAYAETLERTRRDEYLDSYATFGMGYIDDDDIPELLVAEADYHPIGIRVYSYKNGKVTDHGYFGEFGGGMSYLPREGLISSFYMGMGVVSLNRYSFKDGELKVLQSLTEEEVYLEKEDDFIIKYYVDEKEVTQAEYDREADRYEARLDDFVAPTIRDMTLFVETTNYKEALRPYLEEDYLYRQIEKNGSNGQQETIVGYWGPISIAGLGYIGIEFFTDGTWMTIPHPMDLTYGVEARLGSWEGANQGEDYETYRLLDEGGGLYDEVQIYEDEAGHHRQRHLYTAAQHRHPAGGHRPVRQFGDPLALAAPVGDRRAAL